MVPKSETRLLSNGRSPWSVRKRKGDALEEVAAVENSRKRRKEEVGETWKRVFPFHVQVLGAVNRSPAGRRIPAAQKRRPRKGDAQELSAIEWSLNPRLFQGTKARQRGARYTVDRKCIWRLPGTLAQL